MNARVGMILLLITLPFVLTGMTPLDGQLLIAARQGKLEQVASLLKQGARITAANERGETPLHMAAIEGHEAVVRLLLEHGAQLDAVDKYDFTPLHRAAEKAHTKVAEWLLKQGANVDAQTKALRTPLHLAAHNGHYTTAELLLKQGASVDSSDEDLRTPLHLAADTGMVEVAHMLLDHKASVGARDNKGRTPLHIAGYRGHLEVAQLLLERDAYVGVKDSFGSTPLDYAREKGKASLVKLLEEAEATQSSTSRPSAAASIKPGVTAPLVSSSDVDIPPRLSSNPKVHAYAVVIGVERYRNQLPRAEFAVHDAEVVETYLAKAMGYREEQIAVLLNERASKADLEKYVEHWLPSRVEPGSTVFVYFSGHGAPNPKTGEAYLVPYDGDPAFVEATGYPLKRLYEYLGKLQAKEVVVVLDSCFSGAGSRSVIAEGMRPMALSIENPILASAKTVVLAASAGSQASSTYKVNGHGLLTYFFLKGLQGEGDTNKDGTVGLMELFDYLKPHVERVARREFNNEQTPQLLGDPVVIKNLRLVERAVR